jgi:flagellar basal-body rod modification protein FlgD
MAVNFNDYVVQKPVAAGQSSTVSGLVDGQKNLASSYTTFLSLLTAQLQNQDPLSPLDTNSFTQQLVQMTGVQQQLLSNELLQQLVSKKDDSGYDAVSLIGRTATVASGDAQLADGKAQWTYELPSAAASATLTITDARGATVWTGPATALGAGKHAFEWDGKNQAGAKVEDGVYTLKVSAKDASDKAIAVATTVAGKVTGIEQSNGATLVKVGAAKVPLSAITAVTE